MGRFELLGNPVGLLVNVGAGVKVINMGTSCVCHSLLRLCFCSCLCFCHAEVNAATCMTIILSCAQGSSVLFQCFWMILQHNNLCQPFVLLRCSVSSRTSHLFASSGLVRKREGAATRVFPGNTPNVLISQIGYRNSRVSSTVQLTPASRIFTFPTTNM